MYPDFARDSMLEETEKNTRPPSEPNMPRPFASMHLASLILLSCLPNLTQRETAKRKGKKKKKKRLLTKNL